MKQINFWLVSIIIFITSCNGQNKTYSKETISDGQPKPIKSQGTNEYVNIHCGFQDKAGNLWFGTTGEGVYCYDGKLFTQFTVQDGLNSNYVYSILEDKIGHIWIGTDSGLCCYDGKNIKNVPMIMPDGNNFYTTPSTNNAPVKNAVWSMLQDKSGKLWLGTSAGVYCYDGVSFTRFLDNPYIINKDNLHLKMVDCMFQDKKDIIWFGSGMPPGEEGICRYDGKSITSFKPNGDGWIRTILEAKDGNLLIATRASGVGLYNGKDYINFTEKAGIDNEDVTTILKDSKGNIWIATEHGSGQLDEDGGVWLFNEHTFTRFTTKEGLIHNGVFCIVEDKSGNLWFGTRNAGLSRYDGKTFINFLGN